MLLTGSLVVDLPGLLLTVCATMTPAMLVCSFPCAGDVPDIDRTRGLRVPETKWQPVSCFRGGLYRVGWYQWSERFDLMRAVLFPQRRLEDSDDFSQRNSAN
jgi:hypothetical protein